jgi:hypothetical protein
MFLTEAANRGSISTGYDIDYSCKFEADNSEQLYRTPSSDGNMKTWTYSVWFKRTELGASQQLYSALDTYMYFETDDTAWLNLRSASTNFFMATNRKFRDTSAWYHAVIVCDLTDSTAADRLKLYINGVRETSFSNSTYENADSDDNTGMHKATVHRIGQYSNYGSKFCGYMAEINSIDGQALDATDFGEFDDNNIWIPKEYTGSYGTNGFYLDFADAADLGDDESGNGNDWTEGGIAAADQATDTPTNNFAIPNILISAGGYFVITEGATKGVLSTSGPGNNIGGVSLVSTLTPSSGKWYFEAQNTNDGDVYLYIGAADTGSIGYYDGKALGGTGSNPSVAWRGGSWGANSKVGINNVATGSSVTWETEVVGAALDLDNNKIYFHKSGTWINSGDPASGTDNGGQYDLPTAVEGQWVLGVSAYNLATWNVNFGGYTSMSISSAQTDANGYGTFEYAPPSGYYALCTKNLAEYG